MVLVRLGPAFGVIPARLMSSVCLCYFRFLIVQKMPSGSKPQYLVSLRQQTLHLIFTDIAEVLIPLRECQRRLWLSDANQLIRLYSGMSAAAGSHHLRCGRGPRFGG